MDQNTTTRPAKSFKERYFFQILGVVQLLGISWVLGIMVSSGQRADSAGNDYIGVMMVAILIPLLGLTAVINLVTLSMHAVRNKLRGKALIYSVFSLVLSAALVACGLLVIIGIAILYIGATSA